MNSPHEDSTPLLTTLTPSTQDAILSVVNRESDIEVSSNGSRWLNRPLGSNRLVFLIVGAGVCAVVLAGHWWTITPDTFNEIFYNQDYPRIANNPYFGEQCPRGYRLLTPVIVRWLPCSLSTGFKIVNLTGLFLAGWILVPLTRAYGVKGFLPLIAPIPFLLSSGAEWQIQKYYMTIDSVTYVLMGLTVLAFLRNRDDWVSLWCVLGILNRETALLFLPAWYTARFGWKVNRKSLTRLCFTWGPPLMLFAVIRAVWYPLTTYSLLYSGIMGFGSPSYWSYYLDHFRQMTPSAGALVARLLSLHTANVFFGCLLPLFVASLFWLPRLYRRLSIFVLLVWLQFVVAVDVGRLETLAFPVLIPVALLFFQALTRDLRHAWAAHLALGVVVLFFPRSVGAGVLVLAAAYAVRYVPLLRKEKAPSDLRQRLGQTPPVPGEPGILRWIPQAAERVLPLAMTALTFLVLFVFTIKTAGLRPKPILCLPPTMVDAKYPRWNAVAVNRDQTHVHPITPETCPSDGWLEFHKNAGYDYMGIEIPQPVPEVLLMILLADPKEGDQFIIGLAKSADGRLADTKSWALQLDLQLRVYRISLVPDRGENCILIGSDPSRATEGAVRFIVYDVTALSEHSKEHDVM